MSGDWKITNNINETDLGAFHKMTIKKNKLFIIILSCICQLLFSGAKAQIKGIELTKKQWPASWIKVSGAEDHAYGVYVFRKPFKLNSKPVQFPVYVSADNRYKLFVNEKLVSMGPSKSDLLNWKYELVDLSRYLVAGDNVITAQVWNEAQYRPEFQQSFMTGFILQGASEQNQVVNTDTTWKGQKIIGYKPIPISSFGEGIGGGVSLPGWYIAGPGEFIDMNEYPIGWKQVSFQDQDWAFAETLGRGTPKNTVGLDQSDSWRLLPSSLPQMQYLYQRFDTIRRSNGILFPDGYPKVNAEVKIPKNSSVSFLIDQLVMSNSFPTIIFSGGKDAKISVTYAESLYGAGIKGNRNDVENKHIMGRVDRIISNGLAHQEFTSMAYRTFRYIQVEIVTQGQEMSIDDIFHHQTGYPFELKARFNTANSEIDKILEIGWRTASLCANETYMDCPFWEQMQYIGDTRIQAVISLYNSGDDRLVKNAIELIDNSRQTDGLTLSRYPTINRQVIPTFSLAYIGMLHDYMFNGSDMKFLKGKISGGREVLSYFDRFSAPDGSIVDLPNWPFSDWVPQWQRGVAPVGKDGASALLDMQLLIAYQNAAELEANLGMEAFAEIYRKRSIVLTQLIQRKYWDESRQLFSDTGDKDKFSQHTNALAILAGLIKGEAATKLAKRILSDKRLAQGSIYFKYYIHAALIKAGLGNGYLDWLDSWRENIALGLTTWGEDSNVENTRSDCHGWGASPNIEFYRTVLGIKSAGIGFSKVIIAPHLGKLKVVSGEIPHPKGKIKVDYKLINKRLEVGINLPSGIKGMMLWKNKRYNLAGGLNRLLLEE